MRAARPLIASAIGSGRWTQSASGPLGPLALDPHRVAGVADDGRVRRHVVDDDGVRADLRAVADRDRPEQLRARADRHVVLDRRVALAGREAGAAERHALVERHVVADLRRLADDDAHPVVDEEAVADLRGRVDLDPGHRARGHRHRARDERDADLVQRVGDAVREQRLDAGPRREDLRARDAARGGVALAGGLDVASGPPWRRARPCRGRTCLRGYRAVALPDPARLAGLRARTTGRPGSPSGCAPTATTSATRTCPTRTTRSSTPWLEALEAARRPERHRRLPLARPAACGCTTAPRGGAAAPARPARRAAVPRRRRRRRSPTFFPVPREPGARRRARALVCIGRRPVLRRAARRRLRRAARHRDRRARRRRAHQPGGRLRRRGPRCSSWCYGAKKGVET